MRSTPPEAPPAGRSRSPRGAGGGPGGDGGAGGAGAPGSPTSSSPTSSGSSGLGGGARGARHFAWEPGAVLGSRYELLEALGDGTFGRVLLAQDGREDRRVAIKVIRDVETYRENARIEADILADIRRADPQQAGRCSILYETFMHHSRFFCLVFEPLGTSLYKCLKLNAYRGFWLQDIQSFALQCLQALAFLHQELNMAHTDLKPENILLQSMEAARPSHFPRETYWQDVRQLSDAPQSQYLRPADSKIKLIDFGNATYEHDYHSATINTRQYRGPEVVLGSSWDARSDIWSLGCVLMELYTGDLLFNTHDSLEHLALMEKIVRPLPMSVLGRASPAAEKSYLVQQDGRQSSWRLRWPEGASTPASEQHVHDQGHLSLLVMRQHQLLAVFVEWLLTLESGERPFAVEALRHPFIAEGFTDSQE